MPETTATGRATRVRKRGRARPRVGLALAGGGPLGGIYEVGALLALADSLDGIDFNDLDVYVGVSSGGFVAAALANGISPTQMYRLFIDDGADAALTPDVFLRPALAEFAQRASSVPWLVMRATMQWLRDPFHHGAMESMATLAHASAHGPLRQPVDRRLPAPAVRRIRAHRRFPQARPQALPRRDESRHRRVGDISAHPAAITCRSRSRSRPRPRCPDSFRRSGSAASISSTARSTRRCMRRSRSTKASISCCASIPLVPFDASGAGRNGHLTVKKLSHGGLPLVLSQTFRAIIHSRMQVGMDNYRRQYPHADVVLFEPDREDADIFFASIFSYSQRKRLCAAAYHKTRQKLAARADVLGPQLAKHGIALRRDRLADPARARH